MVSGLMENKLSSDERRRLVVDVEVLTVPEGRRQELADCLREFVDAHRDSNETDDLVAVGSAIRKLIAILPAEQLPSVAGLLEAGHRAPVALEVELEVAKSVVRRLSTQAVPVDEEWRPLADRLAEIATTYLNDRLLPRENYAATALNAVLALALMSSDHLPPVLEYLQRLRLDWFRTLLARRATRLIDKLTAEKSRNDSALIPLNELVATSKADLTHHAGVST